MVILWNWSASMRWLPGVWPLFGLSGRSHQKLGTRTHSCHPTNTSQTEWSDWIRRPPLLSLTNRWKVSSPATSPSTTSRSPRRSAPPSPTSGRKIATATINQFDVLLHSCSKSGVLWRGTNLAGYCLDGGRSGFGCLNNLLHVCNFL